MFEILKQEQYPEYEAFALNHKNGTFTQSSHWHEIKKGWGHDIAVVRDENGSIVAGVAMLIKKVPGMPYCFLYAPRGPVMDYDDEAVFIELIDGIKKYAKQIKAFQFKMDPMVYSDNSEFIAMAKRSGFTYDPNMGDKDTIQRRCNYMLFLNGRNEEEMIASFHQKWRYNIRLAQRKGVECRICTKENLDDFYGIYKVTSIRDGFTPRPKVYFEYFLDALGENVRLYICYYEGKPISGAVTTNYAGKVCYVYGASDNAMRNVMPNHLMQWEMIKWAIETNCEIYDFQGIPMDLSGNDHMHGVYLFKKGFNGDVVLFTSEFDLNFKPLVAKFVDFSEAARTTIRKIKRKLKK